MITTAQQSPISKIANTVTASQVLTLQKPNKLMAWMEGEALNLKDGVSKSKTESDHTCFVHTLVSHQTFTILNEGDRGELIIPHP